MSQGALAAPAQGRWQTRVAGPWWLVALLAVTALHLYLLYVPRVTVQGPVSWTDKVVHPLIFLVPLVVGARWWGRWQPVAAILLVHAPVSELVQHYLLPNRSGDVWDAVADVAGIVLGVALVAPLLRRSAARRAGSAGS